PLARRLLDLVDLLVTARLAGPHTAIPADFGFGQPARAREVLGRQVGIADRGVHRLPPDLAGAHRAEDLFHRMAVAVADPDADDQARRVTHGPGIAIIVGRAGLHRRRAVHLQ